MIQSIDNKALCALLSVTWSDFDNRLEIFSSFSPFYIYACISNTSHWFSVEWMCSLDSTFAYEMTAEANIHTCVGVEDR